MNTTRNDTGTRYRSRDVYFHPNNKGTGSACRFELHPAHGDVAGSICLEIAMQNTVGGFKGGIQVFPTFDWENKILVKFLRQDLSQILQVLRGMKEAIGDGKGIFHRTTRANTIIKFSHQLEPRPAYCLSVSRKTVDGTLKNAWFIFDVDEAFALMVAIERAMMYVCFGIPEVIERSQRQIPIVMCNNMQPGTASAQISSNDTENESEEILKVSGDPF